MIKPPAPPIKRPTAEQEVDSRTVRAESALKDALDLLQAIYQASPSGILVFRAEGQCVFANPAAAEIVGAPQGEMLRLNWRELASWRRAGLLKVAERALASDGQVVRYETRTVTAFGKEACLLGKMTCFEANGRPHLLVMFEDATERALADRARDEALDELARSNRELEQFAYVASHDLQEPLRMVASFTQLLAERYRGELDDRADQYIDLAVQGATRMQSLVNNLLVLSRVRQGKHPRVRVKCGELVDQVIRDMAVVSEQCGARVTHTELPEVQADPPQLRQLFQCLLDNAVKFRSTAAPRVEISAAREEGRWIFTVQDNGIGIPPEFQERVFAPFQRLHLRRKYAGDGIGLAIARRVVERHGGTIRVESEPDRGSRFIFDIPDPNGVSLPGHDGP